MAVLSGTFAVFAVLLHTSPSDPDHPLRRYLSGSGHYHGSGSAGSIICLGAGGLGIPYYEDQRFY